MESFHLESHSISGGHTISLATGGLGEAVWWHHSGLMWTYEKMAMCGIMSIQTTSIQLL